MLFWAQTVNTQVSVWETIDNAKDLLWLPNKGPLQPQRPKKIPTSLIAVLLSFPMYFLQ